MAMAALSGGPPVDAQDAFQSTIPQAQVQRLDSARELAPDEAIAVLTRMVEENPTFYRARYNLGLALLQKGDTKAAVSHLQEALKLKEDPALGVRDATIYNSLGWALLQDGDRERALATFEAGTRSSGSNTKASNAKLFNNLGMVYLEEGRLEEARKAFETARKSYGSKKAEMNLEYLEKAEKRVEQEIPER
jgi:Flp pilus assembly protein TadD